MSMLDQIKMGKDPKPRRALLYGPHGVGKSTWASAAPSAVVIQTEDGLGDIDVARFPLAEDYGQVMEAIGDLYEDKTHPFQTVVIDSLDWLERLILAEVCKRRGVQNIEDIQFSKGYTFALDLWREILAGLQALRDGRGMTVVMIAHSKIERFESPEHDSYDRYAPRLHKHAAAVVQEWCDEVFFASYKIVTKNNDEGFGRTRTQGVGSGERIMRTAERPGFLAKNRLGLPEEMPLDWNEYSNHMQKEVKTNG